ncbi:hypothetical protein I302_106742 [Kwoniella bestiolae CBS 10118]|uniref:Uncharacterized protein n=1 Tax=Kwoniella bestiolae CBS 10118 TaxID=1296100 RepID=A0A1B9G0I6_9TREE|nr:hypothetical protein I302_05993 [Kwoniella bestiolae CBS 10118]OCF24532.1 hypothetical protein I302_05993 [Kwoniella bestiolae CBS 10118]
MASMDDLLATFSHDLRAGPQGNDLRDLQAKLAQTLNNPIPYQHHRPIPPPTASTTTTSTGGPLPPPAPASSWNTPPPNTNFLFSSSPQPKSFVKGFPPPSSSTNTNPNVKRENGFFPTTIPERDERSTSQREEEELEDRPYHAAVLPVKASPKETSGFTEDAFRPIWDGKKEDQWSGFKQKGT